MAARTGMTLTARGRAVVGVLIAAVLAAGALVVLGLTSGGAPVAEPTPTPTPTEQAPDPIDAAVTVRDLHDRSVLLGSDVEDAVARAMDALVDRAPVVVLGDDAPALHLARHLQVPALHASMVDLARVLDALGTELVLIARPGTPPLGPGTAPGTATEPVAPPIAPAPTPQPPPRPPDDASPTIDPQTDSPAEPPPTGADPGPPPPTDPDPTDTDSRLSPPPLVPDDIGDRDTRTVWIDGDRPDPAPLSDIEVTTPVQSGTILLVPAGDPARDMLVVLSDAVGATVVAFDGAVVDDVDAGEALRGAGNGPWAAVGTADAWASQAMDTLAWDIDVVRAGVEIPGGGYRMFPNRLFIALYGSPGVPGLGVLGQQDLDGAVERAQAVADDYVDLVDMPVVPTFEIITTVASRNAEVGGDYSSRVNHDLIDPWIEAAADAGIYVILDLQPGRTDFLTQAKEVENLLSHPHVGLALDPEWRLSPNQVHLRQIGSVAVEEVQEVADWLADFTRDRGLPQKMLLLHQFRLSMLPDLGDLVVPPELGVVLQMDGQGSQPAKDDTWRAITTLQAVPDSLWFGWKNFYREDTTVRSPADTVAVEPRPVLVSYQ